MSLATRTTEAVADSGSRSRSGSRPLSDIGERDVDSSHDRPALSPFTRSSSRARCLGPKNFLSWRRRIARRTAQLPLLGVVFGGLAESCCAQLLKVLLDSQYRK